MFVEDCECLATGRGRRAQAGAVPDREPERHENPWGRLPVEEGRRQPVVLGARVLVDIADLKSADEFALVVQNTHFIPLGSSSRGNTACQCSLGKAQRAVQRSGIDWDCSKLESAAFFECVSGLIHRLTAVLHNLANPTQSH